MTPTTDFSHPAWLGAVLVPLLLAGGYVWLEQRRRRRAVVFSNFRVAGAVARGRWTWTRHIPVIALLVALALLAVAMAGPMTERDVARNRSTVVLVIDVSYSMESQDVTPDRFTAAKQAGVEFAQSLADGVNLGLVAFSGTAQNLVAPTEDRDSVVRAIESLKLGPSTATGEAILTALDSIEMFGQVVTGPEGAPPAQIVLLSDGKQTIPPSMTDPRGAFTAADEAGQRAIPVNTISFGTVDGTVDIGGDQIAVPVDDASLADIATRSGGEAFTAASLDELRRVYDQLESQIGYERKLIEDSRPWVGAAVVLLLVAAVGQLLAGRVLPGSGDGRPVLRSRFGSLGA